jgi:phage-related protein (TIGR01555 family)
MVNALILDKEEEWQRITQNFSGLPDMIRVYLMIAAGAGDVPATRFLSQSPNGMDATGDNDLRNYYDNVRSQQKNRIGPTLSTLDEVLIRSALGDRPQEVYYNWKPLWQPTQSEKADNLLKTSQALANIYNTGYVPDEVMSTAVQNMLIEDGSFPGIESAIDDYKANLTEIDETDPEVEAQFSNRNTENDTTTA